MFVNLIVTNLIKCCLCSFQLFYSVGIQHVYGLNDQKLWKPRGDLIETRMKTEMIFHINVVMFVLLRYKC